MNNREDNKKGAFFEKTNIANKHLSIMIMKK